MGLWVEGPAAAAPSLGPAQVGEIGGVVLRLRSGAAPAPLRHGDVVAAGEGVHTAAGARVELVFAGQGLVRLGEGSDAALLPEARCVALRRGALLVQADRMIGGIEVITQGAALVPLGTTYLVEAGDQGLRVRVLEGAVQVVPADPHAHAAVVLPGEGWRSRGGRETVDLRGALAGDPLVHGFARVLPSGPRVLDLADQQRRGILAGRNERLRRELHWQRPPRRPIVLPEILSREGTFYEHP